MEDLPELEYDTPFDDYGEYLHGYPLEATYSRVFHAHRTVEAQPKPRQIDSSAIDFEAL